MSVRQPDVLDRMVARVVSAMAPEAIYLFGSRARGDASADSDYDFLVIVSDDAPAGSRSLSATALLLRAVAEGPDVGHCGSSLNLVILRGWPEKS